MDKNIYEKLERIFRNSESKENPATIKYPFDSNVTERIGYELRIKSFPGELYEISFIDPTGETIAFGGITELSNGEDKLSERELAIIRIDPKEYFEKLKHFWLNHHRQK
jgi:hypothetical protein